MSYQTLTPPDAKALIDAGWTYLDVRTVDEFEAGHPAGAFNVPFAEMNPDIGGMAPNPDFCDVIQKHFAPDAKLVVGCAVGGRSMHACELLAVEGFTNLVNMHGGYSGARDPAGNVLQAGWSDLGYPVSESIDVERSYDQLRE